MPSPSRPSGSKDSHRGSPKPAHRPSPHRTRSQDSPHRSSPRPAATRRHTVQPQLHPVDRPLPPIPVDFPKSRPNQRRTNSAPLPTKDGRHVLIPVPVRAKDAEGPVYVRASPGQHVQFVFSPPEKKSFIGRLLDKIEWEDNSSQAGSPFRYRRPRKPSATVPFYRRLLS